MFAFSSGQKLFWFLQVFAFFLYNKIVPENLLAGMDPFNPPV